MRRGELQALRWSDVDFATGTLHIRRDKAGEGRWMALNSAARDALLAVKREQQVLGSYVFCSPEGRAGGWKSQAMVQRYAHLSPDYVRAAVERMAQTHSEGGTGTKTGTIRLA